MNRFAWMRKRFCGFPYHRSIHWNRTKEIDPNIVSSVIDGQVFSQGNEGAFVGAIGGVIRKGFEGGDRRVDDDRAASGINHVWDRVAAEIEYAIKIGADGLILSFETNIGNGTQTKYSGIRDENIDLSKGRNGFRDHRVYLGSLGYIGSDEASLSLVFLNR